MTFTNTYTRVALQIQGDDPGEFGIVRKTPRGVFYAGSVHDWERDKYVRGVLRFPSYEDAEEYRREYVWEDDANVEKIAEFPGD